MCVYMCVYIIASPALAGRSPRILPCTRPQSRACPLRHRSVFAQEFTHTHTHVDTYAGVVTYTAVNMYRQVNTCVEADPQRGFNTYKQANTHVHTSEHLR